MTRPKHEHLIEQMTDAWWGIDNKHRTLTDAERMIPVLAVITTLLRAQPSAADEDGCLSWAARWLDTRLQEDGSLDHAAVDSLGRTGYETSIYRWGRDGEGTYALRADNTQIGVKVPYRVKGKTSEGKDFATSCGLWQMSKPCTYDDWLRCCGVNGYKEGLL